jgi:hypothetical protein
LYKVTTVKIPQYLEELYLFINIIDEKDVKEEYKSYPGISLNSLNYWVEMVI